MRDFVLRIYIEHGAKIIPRLRRGLLRKSSLVQYLRDMALRDGIGDVALYEVIDGYSTAGGAVNNKVPDCLEITGGKDALGTFLELYRPLIGQRRTLLITAEESKMAARWPASLF